MCQLVGSLVFGMDRLVAITDETSPCIANMA